MPNQQYSSPKMLIELLTASGCGACRAVEQTIGHVIDTLTELDLQIIRVDVVEEIDYAVSLGVRRAPAIALNGKLAFSLPPTEQQLREAILQLHGEQT